MFHRSIGCFAKVSNLKPNKAFVSRVDVLRFKIKVTKSGKKFDFEDTSNSIDAEGKHRRHWKANVYRTQHAETENFPDHPNDSSPAQREYDSGNRHSSNAALKNLLKTLGENTSETKPVDLKGNVYDVKRKRNVPYVKRKTTDTKWNMPNMEGNIPNVERDIPNVTRNIPNVTRNIPNVGRGIPNVTRNIPNVARNILNVGRNIPNVTRNVPYVKRKVPDEDKSDDPVEDPDQAEAIESRDVYQTIVDTEVLKNEKCDWVKISSLFSENEKMLQGNWTTRLMQTLSFSSQSEKALSLMEYIRDVGTPSIVEISF